MRRAVEVAAPRRSDADGGRRVDGRRCSIHRTLEQHYPFSQLKGGANVLIFPDLNSANIAYKLLSKIGGGETLGPILMGMSKPVHLLARGARGGRDRQCDRDCGSGRAGEQRPRQPPGAETGAVRAALTERGYSPVTFFGGGAVPALEESNGCGIPMLPPCGFALRRTRVNSAVGIGSDVGCQPHCARDEARETRPLGAMRNAAGHGPLCQFALPFLLPATRTANNFRLQNFRQPRWSCPACHMQRRKGFSATRRRWSHRCSTLELRRSQLGRRAARNRLALDASKLFAV